jgi:hypothetical protein
MLGFSHKLVSQLILSELSTNSNARSLFNEIIQVLKENDFRIAEEAGSEAILIFVDSVETSES